MRRRPLLHNDDALARVPPSPLSHVAGGGRVFGRRDQRRRRSFALREFRLAKRSPFAALFAALAYSRQLPRVLAVELLQQRQADAEEKQV